MDLGGNMIDQTIKSWLHRHPETELIHKLVKNIMVNRNCSWEQAVKILYEEMKEAYIINEGPWYE